jgi:hypothetical protein
MKKNRIMSVVALLLLILSFSFTGCPMEDSGGGYPNTNLNRITEFKEEEQEPETQIIQEPQKTEPVYNEPQKHISQETEIEQEPQEPVKQESIYNEPVVTEPVEEETEQNYYEEQEPVKQEEEEE